MDGFESKVEATTFDPVLYTRKLYESAPLRMTFQAQNRKQAEAWQKRLRVKITELLGGFPANALALKPQTLEVREFPAYRREKFVFRKPARPCRPWLSADARKRQAPYRAMVCVPGHGRGVDDIVGIDDQGRDRTDKDGYQHDFAIQVAEHGMAAVAIEPMAFGCRRDARTEKKGLGALRLPALRRRRPAARPDHDRLARV